MIAVVVIPPASPSMLGLDAEQSRAMLPLGNRPVLQHIVESLVTQGITFIEVIAGHAPDKVEALLGNGDRWGCRFRYHLARQDDYPYRALKVIDRARTGPWLLIHADRFPCFPINLNPAVPEFLSFGSDAAEGFTGLSEWGGAAVFPAGEFAETIAPLSTAEAETYFSGMVAEGAAEVRTASQWIDASTPAALLDTQAQLLGGRLSALMVSGIERQPGVWISRNAKIHPSAKLIPPIYLGPNCRINEGVRLGPDVALSENCIVDTGTVIEHSLALPGSYVGEGLELNGTIVAHNLLVNVRLGTAITIGESFLLGEIQLRHRDSFVSRTVESLLAAALLVLFLPVTLVSWLYFALVRRISYASAFMVRSPLAKVAIAPATFRLPCIGDDAWSTHRPAGWSAFTRQFLPGLFAVLPGRLSLVGLPPRTAEQLERMPHEWRDLYLRHRCGLISEAAVATSDTGDIAQLYLADAYYAAKKSWRLDLKLVGQYLMRLFTVARA